MPNWIAKLIGKFIAKKVNLQEDSQMDTKKWYQSKTLWTAIASALLGVYGAVGSITTLPPIPEWVYAFLGAFGLYGLRTADKKIETSAV